MIITMGLATSSIIMNGFLSIEDFLEQEILNDLARRRSPRGQSGTKTLKKEKFENHFLVQTVFKSQDKQIIKESQIKNVLNKRFYANNINLKVNYINITESIIESESPIQEKEKEYNITIDISFIEINKLYIKYL